MFSERAIRPERIDTGDYTQAEYERFLKEIRVINRRLGEYSALKKTLLADIRNLGLKKFSVLDVGAGTGELLGVIADFARGGDREAHLVGLDLNELSVNEIAYESERYPEIVPLRGDALQLPFADGAFDYSMCSLFTHHLTDEQIPLVLKEMSRVAHRGIVVIDLERSAKAWLLFQLFCFAFRISSLVRQDGSLSIRKGFKPGELTEFARSSGIVDGTEIKVSPYRAVYLHGIDLQG